MMKWTRLGRHFRLYDREYVKLWPWKRPMSGDRVLDLQTGRTYYSAGDLRRQLNTSKSIEGMPMVELMGVGVSALNRTGYTLVLINVTLFRLLDNMPPGGWGSNVSWGNSQDVRLVYCQNRLSAWCQYKFFSEFIDETTNESILVFDGLGNEITDEIRELPQ